VSPSIDLIRSQNRSAFRMAISLWIRKVHFPQMKPRLFWIAQRITGDRWTMDVPGFQ
jgi:hypothetical protein